MPVILRLPPLYLRSFCHVPEIEISQDEGVFLAKSGISENHQICMFVHTRDKSPTQIPINMGEFFWLADAFNSRGREKIYTLDSPTGRKLVFDRSVNRECKTGKTLILTFTDTEKIERKYELTLCQMHYWEELINIVAEVYRVNWKRVASAELETLLKNREGRFWREDRSADEWCCFLSLFDRVTLPKYLYEFDREGVILRAMHSLRFLRLAVTKGNAEMEEMYPYNFD